MNFLIHFFLSFLDQKEVMPMVSYFFNKKTTQLKSTPNMHAWQYMIYKQSFKLYMIMMQCMQPHHIKVRLHM